MSLPEHKNPTDENCIATAPYNFVPLPEKIVASPAVGENEQLPRRDVYHSDLHTGVIRCTLTTETPMYTRAALEKDEYGAMDAKDKADFFYVDPATNEPVIPGSGIRGALRTLTEIITYGKLQPVSNRQLFFRTLDTSSLGKAYSARMSAGTFDSGFYPHASAGYMEKHGYKYFIRPAQLLQETQFYRLEEKLALEIIPKLGKMTYTYQATDKKSGEKRTKWGAEKKYKWMRCRVWFRPTKPQSYQPESISYYADVTDIQVSKPQNAEGWYKGWFIASGWVPSQGKGKHLHWIVGPPVDDDTQLIEIDEIDIEAYSEAGAGLSQTIERQKMSVLPLADKEQIPCFYTNWTDSDNRERMAFGHTAMFRLPYEYSPKDFLPAHLQDGATTDIVEALFGWVDDGKGAKGDENERQISGRVCVGDAHLENHSGRLYVVDPDQPPIQSLLSGPKATAFQHYLTQSTAEKELFYNYQHKGQSVLRGHKLYWNRSEKLAKADYHDESKSDDSTQHTLYRPIEAGVTFSFSIRFENLSEVELGALMWILNLGKDGKYHLKMGMAKPLGLGSVSIKPQLFLSNRIQRYQELFGQYEWQTEAVDGGDVQKSDFIDALVDSFEKFMMGQSIGSTQKFRGIPRIEALLSMLSSRGLSKQDTAYMGMKEYQKRYVLPDPLYLDSIRRQKAAEQARGRNNQQSESQQPTSRVGLEVVHPASEADVEPGMLLEGKVVEVISGGVRINIDVATAILPSGQIDPPVQKLDELKEMFEPGDTTKVWVRDRKKGKIRLTQRQPKS